MAQTIDFANTDDKAAYILKAITENWQISEKYLKEKEEKQQRLKKRK